MKLTLEQFTAICPRLGRKKAAEYLPHLQAACEEFGITTERRLEAFMAQMCHESGEFTRIEENLHYSAGRLLAVFPKYFKTRAQAEATARGGPVAIASLVYGGRMGNQIGTIDGYAFRGRSPIQLTGRDNYRAAGKALGVDLVNNPDKANDLDTLFRICGWFWKTRGLNSLADNGDLASFKAITKRINGGYNGLPDRLNYWARAKRIIDDREPDEPLALFDEPDDDDIEEIDSPADAIQPDTLPVEPDAHIAAASSASAAAAPTDPVNAGAAAPPTTTVIESASNVNVEASTQPVAAAAVPGGGAGDPTQKVTAGSNSWARSAAAWVAGLFAAASGYVERIFGLDKEIQKWLLVGVAILGVVYLVCKLISAYQVRKIHSDVTKVNCS